MNLSLGTMFKPALEFWGRQSKQKKTAITVIAAVLIAVAALSSFLLNRTTYDVLYRGLSSAEGGEIVARLDEMAVDSKVENDGTIMVPKQDVARLKMQLSSEGYPQSGLSYNLFTGSSDFMTSDLEKKTYLIYQLQDRLQASIKTIKGVKNSIVTISATENSSFVLQSDKIPATASVIIDLQPGAALSGQQVKGIEELVAKSVPGLENKNVTIIDSTGAILNTRKDDAAGSGLASDKFEIQQKAGAMVESKIITLLEPVLGKGGVSVAANVVINFDKEQRTETEYYPSVGNNGMVSKIDVSSDNAAAQAAGGTAGGAAGTDSNTGLPTYAQGGTGAVPAGTGASSVEYLVNQVQSQVQKDGGEVKDVSIAVMIDRKGLESNDLTQIKEMIAFAAGISKDKVVVTDMAFTASKNLSDSINQALANGNRSPDPKLLYYAIPAASVLFILLAFVLIRPMFAKKKRALQPATATASAVGAGTPATAAHASSQRSQQQAPDAASVKKQPESMPGAIVLNETRQQGLKREIKDFSNANPEIVAQLIRTWITEEDD